MLDDTYIENYEAPEVRRNVDMMTKKLCRNKKWAIFVDFKILRGFRESYKVDFTILHKAKNLPIVDIFCQGKNTFIQLSRNVILHTKSMKKGMWKDDGADEAMYELIFRFNDDPKVSNLANGNTDLHDPKDHISLYYHSKMREMIDFINTEAALKATLDKIAPDFLGRKRLTEQMWMDKIDHYIRQAAPKRNIRRMLTEQNAVVSGIGQYLLAQILYEAKIHFTTRVVDISRDKLRELYYICKRNVFGFYEGTLTKTIYRQKVDPFGNEVIPLMMATKKVFWSVPAVQGSNEPEELDTDSE